MRRVSIRGARAIALATSLVLAPTATALPQAAPPAAAEAAPERAEEDLPARLDVLRIGEDRVGASEYGEWLLRERGPRLSSNYALRLLVEREAAKIGFNLQLKKVPNDLMSEVEGFLESLKN